VTPKCDWAGETARYLAMHPPRTRAESWLMWIAILGLCANVIFWSLFMIDRGLAPETWDGYRYRRGGAPAEWAFPIQGVATWICAMAAEAFVLCMLLRRAIGSIAGACLPLGFLAGFASLVMFPFGIHAGAGFGLHVISVVFAAGWLIAMGIASIVVMLVLRVVRGRGSLDESVPKI
jgi:hypothetical protein